jgi:hypothetical protein
VRTLAELQELCDKYTQVAFPDAREIDAMTDAQIRDNTSRMNALAIHIADLVIEAGVHRGESLR